MKFAGITVLYNPNSDTKHCIETYSSLFDFLFLIDNSNIDNSAIFKSLLSSRVIYLPLYSNKGIAAALNIGTKMATKMNCDAIMTMDQDSSFKNNILTVYKKYIATHNLKHVAALTPQYLTERGKIKGLAKYDCVVFSMQSGSLFFLKKMQEIGKFDERIFVDGVDADYFARIRKKKLKVIRCNEAILLHFPAKTISFKVGFIRFTLGISSPERYYYQIRGCVEMGKKYKMFYFFKWALIKYIKGCFLFPDKNIYKPYCKLAVKDGKKMIIRTSDELNDYMKNRGYVND